MSKVAGITRRKIDILVPVNSLRCTSIRQGTYTLTHIETGKVYVGSTTDLYERINSHARDLLLNKHKNRNVQECFNSSREFSLHFTETTGSDDKEKVRIEQKMIDQLRPTGQLLNIALNAEAPWKDQQRPPQVGIAVSKANRERVHSIESREKMSNSRRGKKASPESVLKRMASYPKDPVVINGVEYSTRVEACQTLGLSRSAITYRIHSQKPEYSDYVRKADLANSD